MDNNTYFLNDMQYAFLVGRQSEGALCGVSCHIMAEYRCVSVRGIKEAAEKLVRRHKVLTSRITFDGEVVFDCAEKNILCSSDFSDLPDNEAELSLSEYRKKLSGRLMDIENGEIFLIHIIKMPRCVHLIFEGDCTAFDITSFQILVRDIGKLLGGEALTDIPEGFEPYANDLLPKYSPDEKKQSREYWRKKAVGMSEPPFCAEITGKCTYTAYIETVPQEGAERVRRFAERMNCREDIVLLTAFSMAAAQITGRERFLLNIPILDRYGLPPAAEGVAADFTRLLMFDVCVSGESFSACFDRLYADHREDMKHLAMSGMKVQKLLPKRNGSVTFSSHIFEDMHIPALGRLISITTETPDVLMDCEFFRVGNELLLSFVTPDGAFESGKERALLTAVGNIILGIE